MVLTLCRCGLIVPLSNDLLVRGDIVYLTSKFRPRLGGGDRPIKIKRARSKAAPYIILTHKHNH